MKFILNLKKNNNWNFKKIREYLFVLMNVLCKKIVLNQKVSLFFAQKLVLERILALVSKVRDVSVIFETTKEVTVFLRNFIGGKWNLSLVFKKIINLNSLLVSFLIKICLKKKKCYQFI